MISSIATATLPGQREIRVREAIESLRNKPVNSTTLERMRLCVQAEAQVHGRPQPLQLGHTMLWLLDNCSLPVAPHDLILGRIPEETPDDEAEAFFQDNLRRMGALPNYMLDRGHESFGWDRLLKLGLPGLEAQATHEWNRRRQAGATQETLDFLEGMMLTYSAFRSYTRRYGEAARMAGLLDAAANCLPLADRAPNSFREALQLVWLVGLVFCTMCAKNPTLTFGRMDEYLHPLFQHDITSGILTEQLAGDLIEDFYCKNNLILGRGEHQMSGGTGWERNLTYDAPQYVILGGTRPHGGPCANALTVIFLDRIVPRFKNPVVVLRYTDDFPAALWQAACAQMIANASMMVYNDNVIIPSLMKSGVERDDAFAYEMYGCNHPFVHGMPRRWSTKVNLIGCLMDVLQQADIHGEDADITFDELLRRYIMRFRELLSDVWAHVRETQATNSEKRPGVLRINDCFIHGPLEHACSAELGSLKYAGSIMFLQYIASLLDSFTAIHEVVYHARSIGLAELLVAMQHDFVGHEVLRRRCALAPKFGQDDDAVEKLARRIMGLIFESVDEIIGSDGIIAPCSFETDTGNLGDGMQTGATPDGRRAGEPLSMNASPASGASTNGLTAMLLSLAKLPKDRICAGGVNIRIHPGVVRGVENQQRFASLLKTYLTLGGMQAQLTIADAEELHHAQEQPEQYRDLMVRITGYSASFIDMSKSAQDSIIQREEMNG